MAISTTDRRATFLGNGTATIFPFTFKVFTAADLLVIQVDTSGNLTTLTQGTDYSVALNANQDVSPGGAVTLLAGALTDGYGMIITSAVAELQPVVLTNLGGFFPDVFNTVFDRLTILVQQLQTTIAQAVKLDITDDSASAQLPPAAQRAGKYLYFGADGSVSLVAASPVGTAIFSGPLLGTKDGTNTVFTLTNNGSPLGKTPLQATVWKNFPLIPGDPDGYDLGPLAGQVTYKTAPSSTDSIFATGVFNA